MKPSFKTSFKKYLITLILLHAILIFVTRFYGYKFPGQPEPPVFVALEFLFNVILAMLIWLDLKKMHLKSPLSVVAALIFNLMGVVFFLLKVMDEERKEA